MAQGVPIRVYQITVGTESATFSSGTGQHNSTQMDAVQFNNVKISASLSIDNSPTKTSSDDVEFRIYNLNKSARQALMQENATIMLKAGYDTTWQRDADGNIQEQYDDLPIVFIGGIVHCYTKKDVQSNDIVTVVNCSSDQKIRGMTKTSVSYKPMTRKKDVIQDLINRLGFPTSRVELDSLGDTAYPSGLSVYGSVSDALTTACKENGLQFSIHNGTLSVIKANSQPPSGTQSTSVDAWLYTPAQMLEIDSYFEQKSVKLVAKKTNTSRGKTKANTDDKEDQSVTTKNGVRTRTTHGLTMKTPLNGLVKMHDYIKIDGLSAVEPDGSDGDLRDGIYRVIRIDHQISWPSGDWSTNLKMVEVQ